MGGSEEEHKHDAPFEKQGDRTVGAINSAIWHTCADIGLGLRIRPTCKKYAFAMQTSPHRPCAAVCDITMLA